MVPLIDTHVHLDGLGGTAETAAQLAEARSAGVGLFVVPGVAPGDWPQLMALATQEPDVQVAPGVHPLAADSWSATRARELAGLLEHPGAVAVGEIGLDRLLESPSFAVQLRACRAQLRLAVAAGKPVLVHCRRAYGEMLALLIEERAERVGGILHAYSGSLETARTALDLGFALGFGGTLTWPGARRPLEVLADLPETAIVLETDAPDLAPHPHRGSPNRPAWLTLIAARVAELRGWTPDTTARITSANARRVLRLPEERG